MKLSLETRSPADARGDVLVVGRHGDPARPGPELAALDKKLGGLLSAVLKTERFEGKAGQMSHFHSEGRIAAGRVLVIGLGPRKAGDAEAVRRGAAAAMRRARDLGAASAAVFMTGDGLTPHRRAQAIVEGAILGTYRFDRYLKEKSEKVIQSVAVVEPERRNHAAAREGLRLGEIWAGATCLARDLVNEPANVMTPTYLAGRAEEIAKAGGLELKVLERADCAKLAMGAYLGVAQGSQEPPKFIHLIYAPGRRPRKRVAVVGKGITFDSGGLDLKTADGMLRMKDDMAGAATVLGVFQALPRLKLPIEVHGLIAATENMPSGTAQRPGDIVRAMNGLTIEIGNTDAEGRLTLADALAYARALEPDVLVDNATLTGACVVALGKNCSGFYASTDRLGTQFATAAKEAGEQFWRMPLLDDLKEQLRSDIADLKHTGDRWGGSITAALFLREFVGKCDWIHADIAGPAWSDKVWSFYPKGGTGHGVLTFLRFVEQHGTR